MSGVIIALAERTSSALVVSRSGHSQGTRLPLRLRQKQGFLVSMSGISMCEMSSWDMPTEVIARLGETADVSQERKVLSDCERTVGKADSGDAWGLPVSSQRHIMLADGRKAHQAMFHWGR